jgi:hypothetical protein
MRNRTLTTEDTEMHRGSQRKAKKENGVKNIRSSHEKRTLTTEDTEEHRGSQRKAEKDNRVGASILRFDPFLSAFLCASLLCVLCGSVPLLQPRRSEPSTPLLCLSLCISVPPLCPLWFRSPSPAPMNPV